MPDISKIRLENTDYNIKDQTARNNISSINIEINNINTDLEKLNNKKIIILGDSYGATSNSWAELFITKNNYTKNINAFNWCLGGHGFVGDNNQTYLSELTNNENVISNKNTVEKIIICGGWNDRGHLDSIDNAMSTLMSYIKQNYPNARVYVGMIANYKTINDQAGTLYWRNTLQKALLRNYKNITNYGGTYLNGVENVMHIYDRFENDDIHPNSTGSQELAKAITQAVFNGTYNLTTEDNYITINSTNNTLGTDIDSSTSLGFTINCYNNKIRSIINGSIKTNNISTQYLSLNLIVCEYTNLQKFYRFVNENSRLNCQFLLKTSSNNYILGIGYLAFERDGKLHCHLRAVTNTDVTNIVEISPVNNVVENDIQFM